MVRSVLAVIAGYAAMAIAVIAMFAVMLAFFPRFMDPTGTGTPELPFLVFNLGFNIVFRMLGGYVAALVAKCSEVKHALALAILGAVIGLVDTIATYGKRPLWLSLATLICMPAAAVLGGSLRA